jgi:hypothetical protein
VVVLGLSPGAMAGGHTGILHRMSGTMVRYCVALYSATAAEQYARGKGATDADIEVAHHCIKPEVAAQTASAQLARYGCFLRPVSFRWQRRSGNHNEEH